MLHTLVRAAKRIAVLLPAIIVLVIAITGILPFLHKRLPIGFAIILTYIIAAYILIPAAIRLFRLIVPTRHLQAYCVTPDGFASDPVNIGIIASKDELIEAMTGAGWYTAKPLRPKYIARAGIGILLKRPYQNAPMSRLYLFGRKQDIGFEIPITGGRGHRHHVRFWATSYRPGAPLNFGTLQWHKRRPSDTSGSTLWIGAASRDNGFAFIRHNVQLTHMIHPDTNVERQLIIRGLSKKRRIARTQTVQLHKPYRLANRAWRGYLNNDGMLYVLTLTHASRAKTLKSSRPTASVRQRL